MSSTKENTYEQAKECVMRAHEYYKAGKDNQKIMDKITEMSSILAAAGYESEWHEQFEESDFEVAEACAFVQGFLSGTELGYTFAREADKQEEK